MIYKWGYRIVTVLFSPLAAAVLGCIQLFAPKETKEIWRQRRGIYRDIQPPQKPRIWIHSVSVGEMSVAEALLPHLQKLCPDSEILITSMTKAGYEYANKNLPNIPIYIVPLDFPWIVKRAIRTIQPTLFAILETEFWPNLIARAHLENIPVCLANGRISQMKGIGFFLKELYCPVLSFIQCFSMVSEENKKRILQLGADIRRVCMHPNAKFDALPGRVKKCTELSFLDGMAPHLEGKNVLVAGSIRHLEFDTIIDAMNKIQKEVPEAIFVLAPRHLNRVPMLVTQLQMAGFRVRLCSEAANAEEYSPIVWVLDTMGDLFSLYRHASVCFCGSSLVPLGGQNVLEPAAWEKPVLSGPSLEDFELATGLLLKYDGIKIVADAEELAGAVIDLFQDPDRKEQMGKNAYKAFQAALGGAKLHAQEIINCMPEKKR